MSYFKYELKKLFKNKFCLILVIALIVVNFACGILMPREQIHGDGYEKEYSKEIDDIIYNAKMNYLTIEDKSSQNAHYQLEIVNRYMALTSLDVSGTVSGYSTLISSYIPYVSLLLVAILFVIVTLDGEYSSDLVISSFKSTRLKLCAFKYAAIFASLFCLSVVFIFSNALGILVGRESFYGLLEPLQSIPRYIKCPYPITVLEALLLRWLFGLICILVVSSILFFISVILRKAVLMLVSSILLIAADSILFKLLEKNIFSFYHSLGIENFITDAWLTKFNGRKVFVFLSQIELLFLFYGILLILFLFVSAILFYKIHLVRMVKPKASRKTKAKKHRENRTAFYEGKKILSNKTVIIILLLLVMDFLFLNISITKPKGDMEKIYRYYVQEMSSLPYEEQVQYTFEKKIELSKIISESRKKRELFMNGEISSDEFSDSIKRANAADLELDVMNVISDQLNNIGTLNDEGIKARLIYSTGWQALVSETNGIFILFSVLWIASVCFSAENECGINKILCGISVGNGKFKKNQFFLKSMLVFTFSFVVLILFNTSEILFIHRAYKLTDLTAIAAGADLGFYNKHLSIIGALILKLFYSCIGILLVILFVKLLSLFLKKTLLVLSLSIITEALLMLLLNIFDGKFFNFTAFFSFDILKAPTYLTFIFIFAMLISLIGALILIDKAKEKKQHINVL